MNKKLYRQGNTDAPTQIQICTYYRCQECDFLGIIDSFIFGSDTVDSILSTNFVDKIRDELPGNEFPCPMCEEPIIWRS